jgi:hypothetical protein
MMDRKNSVCLFMGESPMTVAIPEVGWSSPDSILSVVVLPAPFGPRNPTRSPAAISKDTSSTARTVLYVRRNTDLSAASNPGGRSWT